MMIYILSIFLSTSIITTLVNSYDADNKKRSLENITYTVSSFMIDSYKISGAITFDEYLDDSVYDIIPVLNAMSANMDNLVIFVADGEGCIKLAGGSPEAIYYAGDDRILDEGEELYFSNEIVSKLRFSEKISRNDTLDGLFPEKHRVFIQPIISGSGNMVASVMASTTSTDMDNLLKSTTQTIIMSTLWLMLATLIAVYFITERFVSPLRAMSRAAREFAAGRFDVRVPVNGNDEVAELAVAFNNMANSLQHSDETRRLFLANVSHDLRTPMTTISGFIDSIIDGAIPQDKIPYYLEVIASEVRRLSRLVSSLLDITKIQAGERKFNKAPFDICEMAREIIISSEQRLSDKKLDVQFDADRDNMYVSADRDAIYQVLYNLCDNAIKFSDEGGKYIVGINENHGKIKVSVYNEGAGIALEDLPYVFDRFYKSDRSRGLDKTGVGLGLYISRTIIEAHNEKISVESEHGKWCKFTFTLAKTNPPKITDEKKNGEN